MVPTDSKSDLLVYIGAGDGSGVAPDTREWGRIVLVDADSEAVAKLGERFGNRPDVEIFECGLGWARDGALFHQYNFFKANGFNTPAKLLEIYPGLKRRGEVLTAKQDAAEFIMSLMRDNDHGVAMVVDVNGDEGEILDCLEQAGLALDIRQLTVHCGVERLFEGGLNAAEVSSRLEAMGYSEVKSLGAGHRRKVKARRREAAMSGEGRGAALRQERDALTQQVEKAVEATLDERSARERAEAEVERLLVELDAAREGKKAEFERQKSLDGELQVLREQACAEADTRKERDHLRVKVDDLERRNQELFTTMSTLRAEIGALSTNAVAVEQEKSVLAEKLKDCESQLVTAREDLAVSIRQQALMATDQRHLQERYRRVFVEKQRQDELLLRLSNRLGQASEYLTTLPRENSTLELQKSGAGTRAERATGQRPDRRNKPGSGKKS